MRIVTALSCLALAGFLAGCDGDSGTSAGSGSTESGVGSGTGSETVPAAVEPNNTGRNAQDRAENALTAEDQGGSEADRELTASVRRAITANDQLSVDGKNIKIITRDGKVTLRGPVQSAQERSAIESIVRQAGVTSFENELEVKSTAE